MFYLHIGSHKGHNLGSEQMDFDFATSNILDSAVAPSLKDAITEALYDSFTSQSDSDSQISKAYHWWTPLHHLL